MRPLPELFVARMTRKIPDIVMDESHMFVQIGLVGKVLATSLTLVLSPLFVHGPYVLFDFVRFREDGITKVAVINNLAFAGDITKVRDFLLDSQVQIQIQILVLKSDMTVKVGLSGTELVARFASKFTFLFFLDRHCFRFHAYLKIKSMTSLTNSYNAILI